MWYGTTDVVSKDHRVQKSHFDQWLQVQEYDRAIQEKEVRNHYSEKLCLLLVQYDGDMSTVVMYPEVGRGFRSACTVTQTGFIEPCAVSSHTQSLKA